MIALLLQQVAPVVVLFHGGATTLMRNTSAMPQTVTVEVRATSPTDTITPRATVAALISPASFTLGPGERQVVRLHVRVDPHGAVLRMLSCWTPVERVAATARVHLITRVCVNAVLR